MPRLDRIDSSDATVRCPVCLGQSQVVNPADPSDIRVCPWCLGVGRVPIGRRLPPEGFLANFFNPLPVSSSEA